MGVILFLSVVYYVEIGNEDDNDFLSILYLFWWVIIMMIIVGYGDMIFKILGMCDVIFMIFK